ncbi:cfem domain-containing protein [Diplodia corticola]|uniref:Cfem domain-containing protein n=1 Tax=Diplodia corticola TaxID=236234 RepID=A0A1J9QS82_9PEZI|nr:cfem domain-containing protein [Diplodia corticola]OJD30842.1 cfem domain-containing protein [Diplodia corticola]
MLTATPDTKVTLQGYHVVDIPKMSVERQILGQRYNLANQLLYHPVLSIVKMSVILFMLRIDDKRRRVDWSLKGLMIFNVLLMVSTFLADLFQCTPWHYTFDYPAMDLAAQKAAGADEEGMLNGKEITGGYCIDQVGFFLAAAGLAVLTDVLVLIIPMIMVKDLQMRKKRKVVVWAILSIGWIVTAVSIARLGIYAHRFSPNNKDRSYGIGYTISGVEINLAIIAACAPAMNGLTRRVVPNFLSSGRSKSFSRNKSGSSCKLNSRSIPLNSRELQQRGGVDHKNSFTDKEREYRIHNMSLGVPDGWDSEERMVRPLESTKSSQDGDIDIPLTPVHPPEDGIIRTVNYTVRVQNSTELRG